MKNIVLIGMPASGKTTISDLLEKELNIKKYDVDVYLEEKEGRKIKDIFAEFGEEYFRDLETKYTCELSQMKNIIISTGGGVIKRDQNMEYLKKTGIIIFLDREVKDIANEDHTERPLLQDLENIEKLYNERYELYKKYSDYIIKNNDSLHNIVNTVLDIIRKEKE